jgi:hypothetical protein
MNLISLAVLFNLAIGMAFLLSTFFVSGTWGAGLGFQATSTALTQLGMSFAISQWLKNPDPQRVDILGGAFVVVCLMLLQTCTAWSSLSGGFTTTNAAATLCEISGSGGDHATSTFAGLLFVTNVGVGALAYKWRKDWSDDAHPGVGYTSISTRAGDSVVPPPPFRGASSSVQSSQMSAKDAFLDDAEGGL